MFKRKILLAIILVCSLYFVFADNDLDQKINNANQQLNDANSKLNQISVQKSDIENKKSELLKRLDDVQAKIRTADTEIYELGEQIKILEDKIAQKKVELIDAQTEVNYQNDRMKKRLRTLYKAGDFTYVEILMNSASLSDMMTQMDKIQVLLDYDQETLMALAEARNKIEQAKIELEKQEADLIVVKENEEHKRQEMANLEQELQVVHAEYENNYQALMELELAIEAEANELTKTLKSLQAERAQIAYASGAMMWPVSADWTRISSDFGNRIHPVLGTKSFHGGIDIPAPNGSPIYAANSGVVIFAGYKGSYGNAVIIDHGGGVATLYAHSSKLYVNTGQEVTRGETVALIGSTGRSTGNHLHFEVRENGERVDPKKYLYKQ